MFALGESGYSNSRKISVRRNVVWTSVINDTPAVHWHDKKGMYQRTAMTKIVYVELCLIAMEEDDVGSGGFPAIILVKDQMMKHYMCRQ